MADHQRDAEIYRQYVRGRSQSALGAQYNMTQQGISDVIKRVRSSIPKHDRSAMVTDSLQLLGEVRARALEVADMQGVPVCVGKDGQILYDPITKEVARDYTGRLRALALALQTDAAVAKRMGLDAPAEVTIDATVKYEVVGVETDKLT